MSVSREIESLYIRITADASQAVRSVRDVKSAFAQLPTVVSDASAVASSAVKMFADLEQSQVAFGVLMGDTAKGIALVADLQKMVATTPLSMDVLQQSSRMLLQYGVTAENVTGVLEVLGDISGGNASQMRHLSKAYADTVAVGRLLGTELRQFANAGFNPLEYIAKRTGKTIGELRDEMKHGLSPTVNQVTQAMIDATSQGGRFGGLMDKMSGTLAGSWRVAGSQMMILMQNLGKDIVDTFDLKTVSKDFADLLRWLVPQLKGLLPAIGSFAPEWARIKKAAVEAWAWLEPVRAAVADFFSEFVFNVRYGFGQMTQNWADFEYKYSAIFRGMVDAWNAAFGKMTADDWRDAVVDAFKDLEFWLKNYEIVTEFMLAKASLHWRNFVVGVVEDFKKIKDILFYVLGPSATLFTTSLDLDEFKKGVADAKKKVEDLAGGVAAAAEKFDAEKDWQRHIDAIAKAHEVVSEKTRHSISMGAEEFKNITKQVRAFDSALAGSAEWATRVQRFSDMIRATYGNIKAGVSPASPPGATPPVPTPPMLTPPADAPKRTPTYRTDEHGFAIEEAEEAALSKVDETNRLLNEILKKKTVFDDADLV